MATHTMRVQTHQLLLLALPLLVTSCDFSASQTGQGPAIQQDGQTFQLGSNAQVGRSNEVQLSSRAQAAARQLRQTEWWVEREAVERQPHWDGLTTDPPLTVQKATARALLEVRRRFPEVQEWLVHTVFLRNLLLVEGKTGSMYSYPNTWVYEIEFTPKDEAQREKLQDSADVHGLTQVVLLDGTIVPPRTVQ